MGPPADDDGRSRSSSDSKQNSPFQSPVLSASGSCTSLDFDRNSMNSDEEMMGEENQSDAGLSPAPSVYSLTESLKEQSIRFEHGREVNNHSEIYKLAADEREARRLDREHRMYKRLVGGYVPPLHEVLADNDDPLNPKACLDLGCGSGAWILEVANDFPHVQCTGVDLVPLSTIHSNDAQTPPNVRFEIDDITLGLDHFAGDFDVVHVRSISSGVRDYYRIIDDAALVLRPRGLADFSETDWRLYDIDKQIIVPTTAEIWGSVEPPEGWTGTGMARIGGGGRTNGGGRGCGVKGDGNVNGCERGSPGKRSSGSTKRTSPSPFLARFVTLARQAAQRRGGHIDAAPLLHRWFTEHRNFEEVVYKEHWFPCSSWVEDKEIQKHSSLRGVSHEDINTLCFIGREMGEDLLEFMQSTRPLILGTGVLEEVYERLKDGATREIHEGNLPMYMRTQHVYARKISSEISTGSTAY